MIRVKPELLPLTSLRTGTWGDLGLWQGDGVYGELTPTEIIWGRPGNTAMVTDTYNNEPYGPSNDICGTFVPQANGAIDLRLWYYVMRKQVGQYDFINKNFDKDLGMSDGIRVSEMYLNRAEARIMKYLAGGGNEYRTKALEDLNCLRSHRFQTNASRPWQSVEIVDGGELLEFCRAERRRELCGESNHRWFDLRRWGQPALKHVFHINAGEETTYDLAANGAGYVLPIPEFVIGRNPKLRQNQ